MEKLGCNDQFSCTVPNVIPGGADTSTTSMQHVNGRRNDITGAPNRSAMLIVNGRVDPKQDLVQQLVSSWAQKTYCGKVKHFNQALTIQGQNDKMGKSPYVESKIIGKNVSFVAHVGKDQVDGGYSFLDEHMIKGLQVF